MFVTILTYICLTVQVLCCVLLLGVILIQRTKSQGMGLAFGAGMGESLFGSQVGNVLTKLTVTLGVVFLVNTTVLAVLGSRQRETTIADTIPSTPARPAAGTAQPGPVGAPLVPQAPVEPPLSDVDFPSGDAVVPAEPMGDVQPIEIGGEEPAAAVPAPSPATDAPAPAPVEPEPVATP